ncbi:MAG: MgtC/SapB family protein [Bacteroidaceae bacterium]|nr:MgtC/SapB family protein [Bacteroidaceae bacterium]
MITESTAILRVGVSLLFGGIIGIERYLHKHPAGVRTFMLTSLGSTLATIASIWICENNMNLINGDPGRIAAQVLTGIGFIGAGLIIKNNNNDISGLTTATSIFVMAAIGIAVGVGMYLTAAVATLAVTGILFSSFLFHDSRKDKKQE